MSSKMEPESPKRILEIEVARACCEAFGLDPDAQVDTMTKIGGKPFGKVRQFSHPLVRIDAFMASLAAAGYAVVLDTERAALRGGKETGE